MKFVDFSKQQTWFIALSCKVLETLSVSDWEMIQFFYTPK